MGEYIGMSVNTSLTEIAPDRLAAVADIILVLVRPAFTVNEDGDMTGKGETGQVRMSVTAETIRDLIADLVHCADDMDALAARVNLKPGASPLAEDRSGDTGARH